MFVPYHPSSKDWTKPGRMRILELPNFCDLTMESKDPLYNRDRDQWPLFRTKSAKALLVKVDSFIDYVKSHGKRPVLVFYFHPWEFYPMPQGAIILARLPCVLPFIVKNCGPQRWRNLINCVWVCVRGWTFVTAGRLALKTAFKPGNNIKC